jgi:cytochrome c biogenesis protein ResB
MREFRPIQEGHGVCYFFRMAILLIAWVCVSLILCLALAGASARLRPHASAKIEQRSVATEQRLANPAVAQVKAQAETQAPAQVAVLS